MSSEKGLRSCLQACDNVRARTAVTTNILHKESREKIIGRIRNSTSLHIGNGNSLWTNTWIAPNRNHKGINTILIIISAKNRQTPWNIRAPPLPQPNIPGNCINCTVPNNNNFLILAKYQVYTKGAREDKIIRE